MTVRYKWECLKYITQTTYVHILLNCRMFKIKDNTENDILTYAFVRITDKTYFNERVLRGKSLGVSKEG